MEEQNHQNPHVVILPFPAQGHVKPMFKLAELLCYAANFTVTFVNSDHNDARLRSSIDFASLSDRLPSLQLKSLPDGLPPQHPRSGILIRDLFSSVPSVTKPLFRDLMIALCDSQGKEKCGPPTCVIADGIMSFAMDVAEELGIPVITLRTTSAACTWVYFHTEKLIKEGEIPFPENEDMDRPITCIPGFESLLRRRDLPSFCRIGQVEHPVLQFFLNQTSAMTRASALILNTFEELESPTISRLASLFPQVYTIGPLHALLDNIIKDSSSPSVSSDGSLWKQDTTCMAWLDSQPSKSVIYVSFGSIVTLTHDQLLEFWYGLVNSGQRFLWVIRPDSIAGGEGLGQIAALLEKGTKERGCIVGWAAQEEVLAHWAIGGFLTHNGWNSTLESILAGVPMIGWPIVADQQVNSRCVSELWRIGVDMKDSCDRFTIEKMVRELMEGKREEILKSTDEIAKMARDCVKQGGSSYCSLEKLINDLRLLCLK